MKPKLNRAGFRELRNSPAVVADLDARARRVAEAAGDGFVSASGGGKTRGRASVATVSNTARRAAAGDPAAFLRALQRGRGVAGD